MKTEMKRLLKDEPNVSSREAINHLVTSFNLRPLGDGSQTDFFDIIRQHLHYLKRKEPTRILVLQDVIELLQERSLQNLLDIQKPYQAKDDFKDALEVAEALGCENAWDTILLPVSDVDIDAAMDAGGDEVDATDRAKMLGSVIATSPAHLFTMLQTMGPGMDGYCVLHSDESVKLMQGVAEQVLSIGPCSIDMHGKNYQKVTKNFRPAAHCMTSCKSYLASFVLFRLLVCACHKVFGKVLNPDGFNTDYSGSLRNGYGLACPGKPLMICVPHMFGCVGGRWRRRFSLTKEQVRMIKMHISICAGCRTFEAFCCAFALTIKDLRTAGLVEFAKFFETYYGHNSACKGQWYVKACNGTIFIYPNNNPVEAYWAENKGVGAYGRRPVVDLNLAPGKFLLTQLPKLLFNDYLHHCGTKMGSRLESKKWIPLSPEIIGVCALMMEDKDMFWVDEERTQVYGNSCRNLNKQEWEQRIAAYQQTMLGQGSWISAEHFAAAHSGLCHVFVVDEDHHPHLLEKLGISHGVFCFCEWFAKEGMCPCAAFLLDRLGLLGYSLLERMTVVYTHRAGAVSVKQKKARYNVDLPKAPPYRAIYSALGIDAANAEVPINVQYLCSLTPPQKKKLRRILGHLTPPELYFGMGPPRHLNLKQNHWRSLLLVPAQVNGSFSSWMMMAIVSVSSASRWVQES
jgi:hypothetical protein